MTGESTIPMLRFDGDSVEIVVKHLEACGWMSGGDYEEFFMDVKSAIEHACITNPAAVEGAQGASGGPTPIGFVHPLYLDGSHLAMEVSTVRLSPKQVPVYLAPPPATGSGGEVE